MFGPKNSLPLATSFEGYFNATRTLSRVFAFSPLIYVLVGLALRAFAMPPGRGFTDLNPSDYNIAFALAGVASFGLVAVACFVLPQFRPVSRLVEQSSSALDLAAALSRAHLQRVQLMQVPAIMGLVLFLMNGILWHLVLFTALSLVGQLLIPLSRSEWDAALDQLSPARRS